MNESIEDLLASGAVVPDRPNVWSAMLAAAPAPSSLAGGEDVQERVERIVFEDFFGSPVPGSKERLAKALIREFGLAALSPEAPARDGSAVDRVMSVLNHWFDGTARVDRNSEMVAQLAALVTPRHESPASDSEAMQRSMQQILDHDEAPAEGAGLDLLSAIDAFMPSAEVAFLWSKETPPADEVQRYRERYWAVKDALLRARSSAPEAREGEAVAWVPIHPRNGPIWPECGPGARSKDNLKSYPFMAVYTRPAAPSADKLRIAVDALEAAKRLAMTYAPLSVSPKIIKALATLKAEAK